MENMIIENEKDKLNLNSLNSIFKIIYFIEVILFEKNYEICEDKEEDDLLDQPNREEIFLSNLNKRNRIIKKDKDYYTAQLLLSGVDNIIGNWSEEVIFNKEVLIDILLK